MSQKLVIEDISTSVEAPANFEEAIRRRMEALMDIAPSDANAFATLRKVRQGYEGFVKIVSTQGRFVAEAVGGNVNELVTSLARQIGDQLKEWRGYRFKEA